MTEKFKTIYHISADVTKATCIEGVSRLGFPSFVQELELICIYGQTEFKAQLCWMEGASISRTHLWSTSD